MAFPVTDFANFAALPPLMRKAEVRLFNSFIPKQNYRPLRSIHDEILRLSSFGDFCDRPDFSVILEKIIDKTKNYKAENRPNQLRLNLFASRALYEFSIEQDVYSIKEHFGSFAYSMMGGIKPFEESVVFINGEPHIVFLDFRKKKHLTPTGRKFIFSVMHHHIRSKFEDLSDTKLAVLHMRGSRTRRYIKTIVHDESELFSLKELEQMVSDMFYEIAMAA